MRTVIYDAEGMEPLTVIDVPQTFIREIEMGRRGADLCFPTRRPLRAVTGPEDVSQAVSMDHIVRIRFEPIMRGRERLMWLATTADGETALLLRSVFLPGQQAEVNRREETAFLKGLFSAMA